MSDMKLAWGSDERADELRTSSSIPQSWPKQASSHTPIVIWLSSGTAGTWSIPDDAALSCLGYLEGDELFAEPGTTIGAVLHERTSPTAEAVLDIRRRSGLTWQQLARVFDVDRRSLHFWAKGSRPSGTHVERLELVRAILQQLDTGDPEYTRQRLVTPVHSGGSILDLLAEKRDREALESVRSIIHESVRSESSDRPGRRPPALPREEREARRALPPLDLLGTIRDSDHPASSGLLGVSPVPGLEGW